MNKKILLKFSITAIVLIIVVTAVTLINLRQITLKAAVINAENFAEVVKEGLVSYMVNDEFHTSDLFLKNILDNDNITNIKLSRSQEIQSQYGFREDKVPSSVLEKSVIESGKTEYKLNEDFIHSNLEITIPLKYNPNENVDCKSCHNVPSNNVLGTLTLEMNISELKLLGFSVFYVIPLIILISMAYFWFILRNSTITYETNIKKLENSIKKSIDGNYETIESSTERDDMNEFINDYNKLITNFKTASEDIDNKLRGFIGLSSAISSENSSLDDTKEVISNLSNLYQFKKQIELDSTNEEIFDRLSQVLINKFNLKNFTIFEIFKNTEKINVINSVGQSFYCMKYLMNSPIECRCSKISNDVHSINYHKSCPLFDEEGKYFYCVNINLSDNRDIIFNFCLDTQEELENLKKDIVFIKSFINEAIPSIEVKILMNALTQSAFTDNLTGLYNRTFLDEQSKKLIPQVKRDDKNIGVLLLDMDHFKAVNDEYGHDIGDKVLKELARIINENIRESDIAFRYGGEEFLILLVDVKTKDDAFRIADKIRNKVKENEIDVYAGSKLRKTISIGLAMFPENGMKLDSVIKNADIALYEAKKDGRDNVKIFNEEQVSSIDLF